MPFTKRDIWRLCTTVGAIDPEDAGASATINGDAVDVRTSGGGGASAIVAVQCGAATGAPSAQTVDAKIQDSADGSTGWADLGAGSAAVQLTADDTFSQSAGINLTPGNKGFIRAVVTVVLTAGTTPTIPVGATLVIGGRDPA